jgi:hypothetical protein
LGGTAVPPNRLRKRVSSRKITNFQEAVAAFFLYIPGKELQQPLLLYPEGFDIILTKWGSIAERSP